MRKLKEKQTKEVQDRTPLRTATMTLKGRGDVAKEHDKYLSYNLGIEKPKVIIFFGVPGSGKSHIARILARRFNVFFYEADNDYTEEMRRKSKISRNEKDQINREFYSRVIDKTRKFLKSHNKVFVATALGTQENRHQFIDEFGNESLFVLVKPNKGKHLEAVFAREKKDPKNKHRDRKELKDFLSKHLEKKYRSFDKPDFKYLTIENKFDDKSVEEACSMLKSCLNFPS